MGGAESLLKVYGTEYLFNRQNIEGHDTREEKMANGKSLVGLKYHLESNDDDIDASRKVKNNEIETFYVGRSMEQSEKFCLSEKGARCSETCDDTDEIVRGHNCVKSRVEENGNTVYCLRFRRDFLAEKAIITDIGYALEDQYGSTTKVVEIERRTRGWKIWVKGQWMKEKLIQRGLLIKNRLYHMEEVS